MYNTQNDIDLPERMRNQEDYKDNEEIARRVHNSCGMKDLNGEVIYDEDTLLPVYNDEIISRYEYVLDTMFKESPIPQGVDAYDSTLVLLGLSIGYLQMGNIGETTLENGIVEPIYRGVRKAKEKPSIFKKVKDRKK